MLGLQFFLALVEVMGCWVSGPLCKELSNLPSRETCGKVDKNLAYGEKLDVLI